jgi:biopolymer transport protein ExbD
MKLAKKDKSTRIPDDSMADIAFLLIIFFMLTTTFSVNKGFDFGIPPTEETSTEESQSRPALTVIVDSVGDSLMNYVVIVVDEQGERKDFSKSNINGLYDYLLTAFDNVKIQQPDNWWKLPLYVLVRESAPFEGFVDVWEEVQLLEDELLKEIKLVEFDEAKQRLATHIPHVAQVEDIIASYEAAGKLILSN